MSSPTPSPLAFLGLGAMGHAMSLSLLRRSFPVIGFDISTKTLESFMSAAADIPEAPAQVASSPAAACRNVALALIMVANQNHVESALLAPETGALHALAKNAAIVVNATVSPTYMIELRKRLDGELGRPDVILIDAPVSGGVARSATGTLTIMASSTKPADLERPDVRSALNALSDNGKNLYIFSGGLGSGLKLKALNQVNCGINIAAASEIMGLAAALGLDTKKFYDELKSGAGPTGTQGQSWMLLDRGTRMLTSSPKMASATSIILKDVGIVLDEAGQRNCQLRMVQQAKSVLDGAAEKGMLSDDDSCVVKSYLGESRDNLVVERAGSPAESSQEQAGKMRDLICRAHDCVLLMGAYETATFAEALGMMQSDEQVRQWITIIGGAAGGSPVFTEAMQTVFAHVFQSGGGEADGSLDQRFKSYSSKSFGSGRIAELDTIVELAEAQKYDPTLVKEARAWLGRLLG